MDELEKYFGKLFLLCLHMKLNIPEITLNLFLTECSSIHSKSNYEIKQYSVKDFYCADGFPKDGKSCVVIMPAPYRDSYVY